jgi:hypothetical protein
LDRFIRIENDHVVAGKMNLRSIIKNSLMLYKETGRYLKTLNRWDLLVDVEVEDAPDALRWSDVPSVNEVFDLVPFILKSGLIGTFVNVFKTVLH